MFCRKQEKATKLNSFPSCNQQLIFCWLSKTKLLLPVSIFFFKCHCCLPRPWKSNCLCFWVTMGWNIFWKSKLAEATVRPRVMPFLVPGKKSAWNSIVFYKHGYLAKNLQKSPKICTNLCISMCFWNQSKTVYLQGLHTLRPHISTPGCTAFQLEFGRRILQ